MKTLILCGGFGTRLRSVIGESQKAVADVAGKPFLEYVVRELGRAGLRDLVFCTHYQSAQVEEVVARLRADATRQLQVVREDQPLGTGGAVVHAVHGLGYDGPLLVINADTFVSAQAYQAAVRSQAPSLVVTEVEDCARYGAVQVDSSMQVLALQEKAVSGPGRISVGVYRLDARSLAGLPQGPLSMERDILPAFVERRQLRAVSYTGPFLDIGTPDSLAIMRGMDVEGLG